MQKQKNQFGSFLRLAAFSSLLLGMVVSSTVCAESANKTKADKIIIAADQWCSYNCDPNSDEPGFLIEMAKVAFERHGIEVEYQVIPWTRAIDEAREGNISGIVGAYITDAPDFIFPETSQAFSQNGMFISSASDSWVYNDLDSLENRSLGVISDYSYGDALDQYIEENKNDMSRIQILFGDLAAKNNIRKLAAGRIDVIIEDVAVMEYILSQDDMIGFREKIRFAGVAPGDDGDRSPSYIAFSPQNPFAEKYAQIMSVETKNMQESGEYFDILQKYGIQDLW
ncbi:MAG: substrate-binding periplasmic protein [Alphaproteobacteria bacterium]